LRCFELRTRGEVVELSLEPIVKGYLTLCRNGGVEARTYFTSRRVKTYIVFYSRDGRCDDASEALLNALLPESVSYSEVDCGGIVPFRGG